MCQYDRIKSHAFVSGSPQAVRLARVFALGAIIPTCALTKVKVRVGGLDELMRRAHKLMVGRLPRHRSGSFWLLLGSIRSSASQPTIESWHDLCEYIYATRKYLLFSQRIELYCIVGLIMSCINAPRRLVDFVHSPLSNSTTIPLSDLVVHQGGQQWSLIENVSAGGCLLQLIYE